MGVVFSYSLQTTSKLGLGVLVCRVLGSPMAMILQSSSATRLLSSSGLSAALLFELRVWVDFWRKSS